MYDTGFRRYDLEVVEGLLSPFEELVSLAISRVFQLRIELERFRASETIHLHGVIDDELGGLQRIDPRRVAAHGLHRLAHGCEIDHCGNAGEVLHQHACRAEGDFLVRSRFRVPIEQRVNVFALDGQTVLIAQQVLQQDFQRERQSSKLRLIERSQPENLILAAACGKTCLCAETVHK